MSAPVLELPSAAVALAAAFGASLHCAAMCGPIRLLAPRGRVAYQAGRGLAYGALGGAAGLLGWSLPPWALVAFVAAAALMILLRVSLPSPWRGFSSRLTFAASRRPLTLGLASGLLPCGLLHGWVAVAAATASPVRGALVLGALWLGTLPALELGPWLLAKPLGRAYRMFPRALPLSMLLLAAAPAVWRARAAFAAKGQAAECHHHGAMPVAGK